MPPFGGETVQAVLYGVVHEAPEPLDRVRPGLPAALVRIVNRALAKDRLARYQQAEQMLAELRACKALLRTLAKPSLSIAEALARLVSPAAGSRARRVAAATAVVAVIGSVIVLAVISLRRGRVPLPEMRPRTLAQATSKPGIERFPVWSPDGRSLVYAGEAGAGRKLFVKRLDSGEERQITTGAGDDIQPEWSPDGGTILFVRSQQPDRRLEPGDVFGQYDGGDVWSIDLASGREARLVESAFNPAYSPDGTRIAVDASWAGPRSIWTLDGRGRNPQQITTDVSEAVVHLRPRWSPDGATDRLPEHGEDEVRRSGRGSRHEDPDMGDQRSPPGSRARLVALRSVHLLLVVPQRRAEPLAHRRVARGHPAGPLQQLTTGAGQDRRDHPLRDGARLAFTILRQNADLWTIPVWPATGRPSGPPAAGHRHHAGGQPRGLVPGRRGPSRSTPTAPAR